MLGSGAREHALVLALLRDPDVTEVGCSPGNAGTARIAAAYPVNPADAEEVLELVARVAPDLVVVGPEAPLVAGVADAVRAAGVACFGPSAAAARIEGSKSFAKQVMAEAGVPTAASVTFHEPGAASDHLAGRVAPYVVKADGLAAGKGVLVTTSLPQAQEFAREALREAGSAVVVEDYLDGPEVSLFAVTDGVTVVPLLPAQDAKRLGDGDTGPNTGGMGAYAPLPWLPAGTVDRAVRTVLQPVVDRMCERGTPYAGLLYAGLALTGRGIEVVEFNARFGDPETQVVLALLASPLAALLSAAATGTLAGHPPLRWHDAAAVTVVVAADGYPGAPVLGDEVVVGPPPAGVEVLHAGTRYAEGCTRSSGGRVLSVTAVAETLARARVAAYGGVSVVHLHGGQWRTDIALDAVAGRVKVPPDRP